MVDLSKVKLGDAIKYRNGIIDIVTDIALDKKTPNYSYKINHARFTKEGEYNLGILSNYDIVSVSHIDADTSNVDIAKINLDDTIKSRDGKIEKVFLLERLAEDLFVVNGKTFMINGECDYFANEQHLDLCDVIEVLDKDLKVKMRRD